MGSMSLESAGADMFGMALNWGLNEFSAQEAHRRQKETIKYQNDLQRENWHMQNAYNNPVQQRKRLAAAGLNPDLMYSGGAGALQAGPVGSVASPSGPQAHTGATINGAGAVANEIANRNTDIQEGVADSEKELNYARAAEAYANAGLKGSEKEGQDIANANAQEIADLTKRNLASQAGYNDAKAAEAAQNVQNLIQGVNESMARVRNLDADTFGKYIDNQLKRPLAQALIRKYAAEAHLSYTQAVDLISTRAARIRELNANASLTEQKKKTEEFNTEQADYNAQLTAMFGIKEHEQGIVVSEMQAMALACGAVSGNMNAAANLLRSARPTIGGDQYHNHGGHYTTINNKN